MKTTPWAPAECATLRACRSYAEAYRALPHRTRTAVKLYARRHGFEHLEIPRVTGPHQPARPPRTVIVTGFDQRRFLRLLAAVPMLPAYDVDRWLAALRQTDWRAESDALTAGLRVRFPAAEWPLQARGVR